MLNSILSSATTPSVALEEFLICSAASLMMGIALAWIHTYKNQVTKNFILTLVLLPLIVQTVIMLVNGNLGTGVAVMGAFSLIRFRSLPGNSREIVSVFLAMAIGLAAGMGYLGVAVILLVVVGCITILMAHLPKLDSGFKERELKVTIPENLDYQGVFDDLFDTYTSQTKLMRVRTVNMGSLYELQYHMYLKHEDKEKEFLDQIRCRNGNLSLVCGRVPSGKETL
ncbi:MAG: DUF4956 domain-containing protein [Lachnospiraceae bacterium]